MKFIDLINEDSFHLYKGEKYPSEKELKKVDLIYKLYKKGKKLIELEDNVGVMVSYELSDEKRIVNVENWGGSDKDYDLKVDPRYIDVYVEINPDLIFKDQDEREDYYYPAKEKIENILYRNFMKHGIFLHIHPNTKRIKGTVNVHYVSPKGNDPINEEEKKYTPEDITAKDTKKAELIYGLYKTGKFKFEDIDDSLTYHYELPDEWYLSNDEDGTLNIVCKEPIELHTVIELSTGPWKKHVEHMHEYLYRDAVKIVKAKFERHNINLFVEPR